MDIGIVIKKRRALLGISQQDLSDYSGVGISTVKDLERGVGNPSLQTLQKIPDVVGMEIPQETYALIDRSFLNDKMKRTYKRVIEERKTRFIRQSE